MVEVVTGDRVAVSKAPARQGLARCIRLVARRFNQNLSRHLGLHIQTELSAPGKQWKGGETSVFLRLQRGQAFARPQRVRVPSLSRTCSGSLSPVSLEAQ